MVKRYPIILIDRSINTEVVGFRGSTQPTGVLLTARSISAAERVAQGYAGIQAGIGAFNTTTKIQDGKMDWSSPLSYLEVAGSFAPLIGAGARQLGKIGVVENAIAKATAVGENIWNSAGNKLGKLNQAAGDLLSDGRNAWNNLGSEYALAGGSLHPEYAGNTFTQQAKDSFQHYFAAAVTPSGTGSSSSFTNLSSQSRQYLNDIKNQTGLAVPDNQRALLVDNLQNNSFSKLAKADAARHRSKFNNVKDDLITEWETNTSQVWPRYNTPVLSKSGRVLREVGDPYDAHHIIESSYGGSNEWWNIHPAEFPSQHQGGIHRSGGILRQIF